ncbi:MAG TPA: hypothetical protein DHV28_12620 [Ignavibacteriales bacterium]|nr:hypothetical protein [Ignavibacteriales bacterium]
MVKEQMKTMVSIVFTASVALLFSGCQDPTSVESADQNISEKQAIINLLDEDQAIASFEPNFDEGGTMQILGKISTEIYPLRVGQKMKLTNHNVDVNIQNDTAYAFITNTFDGQLFIAATYDPNSTEPDTIIKKSFTSVITRNAILVKMDSTRHPKHNWKVVAISLPEGGTLNPDIDITKLTVYLPGDSLVITSPNDFYLYRKPGFPGKWKPFPIMPPHQDATLKLELTSAYPDTDFVTITFGADFKGMNRIKRKFVLVSSEFNGTNYEKVYVQTLNAHRNPGFFHSVINAMPLQVIKDDSTPVEMESWGLPYFVRPQ